MEMVNLFSWGKSEELPSSETPETSGPVATTLSAEAREAAERELQVSTRRRGRPSKSADAGAGNSPALSPALQAEINRQLEQSYDPKIWGALLSAPGDLMLVVSGREHWKLSKDERDTLGACGSAAARTLLIQNPRTLAFLMLGSALFSAYVPRIVVEVKAKKKEQAMRAKAEKEAKENAA
jgi:hypothetical protein